ncbi:hypothetical protein LTR17_018702 [Elasticomyces elasticus]|nr:hypothetical protein LTR17_018702 [Elasticomyces elasticus]
MASNAVTAQPSTTLNNFYFEATILDGHTAYQLTSATIDNSRGPNFVSGRTVDGMRRRHQIYLTHQIVPCKLGEQTMTTHAIDLELNIAGTTKVTMFYVNDRMDAELLTLGQDGIDHFSVEILSKTSLRVTAPYKEPGKRVRLHLVDPVSPNIASHMFKWPLNYWQQRIMKQGETVTQRREREQAKRRNECSMRLREKGLGLLRKSQKMGEVHVKRERIKCGDCVKRERTSDDAGEGSSHVMKREYDEMEL